MKLVLENFKCWEKKTINFPSLGLVLLNGKSGVGKTSILQAIYFALYGKGSKIAKFGSSGKVSVTLETDKIRVKRNKKPNRLQVKIKKNSFELEGEAAQEYINKEFGYNFETTCYIQQKGLNSFLTMSPSEKLEFLERMMMADFDVTQYKAQIKSKVTSLGSELSRLQGENGILESVVKTLKEAYMGLRKDKNYGSNLYRKIEDKTVLLDKQKIWNVKKSNAIKSQTKTRLELENVSNQIQENLRNQDAKKHLAMRINDLIDKIDSIAQNKEKLEFILIREDLQKEYENLKKQKSVYYDNLQYETLFQQFQELIQDRKQQIEGKMSDIPYFEPWMHLTLEQCNENILLFRRKQEIEKDIKSLQANLKSPEIGSEDIKIQIQNLTRELELVNLLQCPHCQGTVVLAKGKLQKSEKEFKSVEKNKLSAKLKELEAQYQKTRIEESQFTQNYNKIEKLQKEFNSIQLPQNIDLEKYRDDNVYLEKLIYQLQELEEGVYHQFPDVKRLHLKLSKLKKTEIKIDIKQVETSIQEYEEKISKNSMTRREINFLEKSMAEYDVEYEKLSVDIKKIKIIDENELTSKKQSLEDTLKSLETKSQEAIKRLAMIDDQSNLIDSKTKYYAEKKRYVANVEKEKKTSSEIVQYKTILENAVKAESMVLETLITTLNIEINKYLEYFFTTPIYVELTTFKELKNKSTKPCVHVTVKYGDEENYDISCLSGGEFDRLQLAFTLAFSETFSSSLVMFDESISSLDAETTEFVLKQMRDVSRNKLIIIIAHQTVHGIYDHTIDF